MPMKKVDKNFIAIILHFATVVMLEIQEIFKKQGGGKSHGRSERKENQ